VFGRFTVPVPSRICFVCPTRLARNSTRRHDIRVRAQTALAQVGLEHEGARIAAETSYGERRRLELAMVLVQDPRLLLLDEPLAGLSGCARAGC
jgi:ABC-type branched-subunit amino acid transport system ATPase component